MRGIGLLYGLSLLLSFTIKASGQDLDTSIAGIQIQMDEVVVFSARNGWDVDAFIRRMKADTTFYKAFLGLRVVPYVSDNEIRFYDEKDRELAHLENTTRQTMDGDCRTVEVLNEAVSGKYYKRNGEPFYYTSELFRNLFFRPRDRECGSSDLIARQYKVKGKVDRHKEQLKQLIFNPGSKISGVPFMGDKASVFDPENAVYYDFQLGFVRYQGEDCYCFRVTPKTAYKDKVVFNYLYTWFRASDYAILARDYALSFRNLLYDFDVEMKVRLQKQGPRLLPSSIDYKGNWHIFGKRREISRFAINFRY